MTRRRLVALVLAAAAFGSLVTTLVFARLVTLDALQHAQTCVGDGRDLVARLIGAGFVTLVAAVLLYPTEAP